MRLEYIMSLRLFSVNPKSGKRKFVFFRLIFHQGTIIYVIHNLPDKHKSLYIRIKHLY
jgi:hypothetical protein